MPKWIQVVLYKLFPTFAKPLVTEEESNIGKILHDMGLVTKAQISRAVGRHEAEEQEKIGMCFVKLGFISKDELDEALDLQSKLRNGKAIEAKVIMIERHMAKHRQPHKTASTTWKIHEVKP